MESLTFNLSNGRYAIPLHLIDEMLPMIAIQPIPELPAFIKGGINLRGQLLPVIDLVERLGAYWQEPPSSPPPLNEQEAEEITHNVRNVTTKYTNKSRLIVVLQAQHRFAVILNGVAQIKDYEESDTHEKITAEGVQADYLQGIVLANKETVQMVYVNQLLTELELSQLN